MKNTTKMTCWMMTMTKLKKQPSKTSIPNAVTNYISRCKKNKKVVNIERLKLFKLVEDTIFPKVQSGELYFNHDMIRQFIRFTNKYYFPLQPFQKFLISFIFLYESDGDAAYYEEFFIMMGRGGGKNGLISALSHFFISKFHGIRKYDGAVVANSEEQAETSFEEIYDAIDRDKTGKLESLFPKNKEVIISDSTKSKFKFYTSNPKTKDGGRQGFVIFDEIHQYENSELVNVFTSGLGKKKDPRTFFIGTDGTVRDGYLDNMKRIGRNILDGEFPTSRMFVFICKLDEEDEVKDIEMWQKANPMFEEPLGSYAKVLFKRVKSEYDKFDYDSTARSTFMTKRMNLPEEDPEKIVAKWEDILKTNRPMPLLNNRIAIVGVDYASVKDFAAVGFLFRIDNNYVWHSHSFARKEFLDKVNIGPSDQIPNWEKDGLITVVDAPTIAPELLTEWVQKEMKRLNLRVHKVMIDRFRYDITRPAFEGAGFELEPLNYMPSVHAQLAPRIETIFSNHQVIWGDNPLMRWYTNNTAVKIKKDGNKEYIKKDPVRRKTDGFHAFIHALFKSDEIVNKDIKKSMDLLDRMLG